MADEWMSRWMNGWMGGWASGAASGSSKKANPPPPPPPPPPCTAPPHPVMAVVPPRTKSPHISSPESCTIASYVTLRKSKKSDSSRRVRLRTDYVSSATIATERHSFPCNLQRSPCVTLNDQRVVRGPVQGRPRSAAEQQQQLGEVRSSSRMSVEEQLERMRRNQEASTLLRGRRRETPFTNLQVAPLCLAVLVPFNCS